MCRIPLYQVSLGPDEATAVGAVLQRRVLTQGLEVVAFERELAAYTGQHVVLTSSGTTALWALLTALGVGAGAEVIIPGLTFAATANAVLLCNATPVIVDIAGFLIDPAAVAAAITPQTRAVIAVDQFGFTVDLGPLAAFCAENNLELVVDGACALGSPRPGRNEQTYPTIVSFHPRKIITCGEGGAVLTADEQLKSRVASLVNHGRTLGGQYICAGHNGKLGELSAALGRVQLAQVDRFIAARLQVAERYNQALAPLPRYSCPSLDYYNGQSYPLQLSKPAARALIAELDELGVTAVNATDNLAHRPFFNPYMAPSGTPHLDQLADRLVALPIYPELSRADQDRVIAALLAWEPGR